MKLRVEAASPHNSRSLLHYADGFVGQTVGFGDDSGGRRNAIIGSPVNLAATGCQFYTKHGLVGLIILPRKVHVGCDLWTSIFTCWEGNLPKDACKFELWGRTQCRMAPPKLMVTARPKAHVCWCHCTGLLSIHLIQVLFKCSWYTFLSSPTNDLSRRAAL
jgi:hypothetical protein